MISSTSKLFGTCICMLVAFQAKAILGNYPVRNFTPAEYKAGIQNIDFAQNRNMTLFVANNLGVLSYNGGEWATHDFHSGEKKRSLAFDDKKNRLYVGSQGEFGYYEHNWNYVSLSDSLLLTSKDFDEVWDVFIINSNIYFCTFQGIYLYDGNTVSLIDHPNGLHRSFNVGGKLLAQSRSGDILELLDKKLIPSIKQNQTNQVIAGLITAQQGYLLFYNRTVRNPVCCEVCLTRSNGNETSATGNISPPSQPITKRPISH